MSRLTRCGVKQMDGGSTQNGRSVPIQDLRSFCSDRHGGVKETESQSAGGVRVFRGRKDYGGAISPRIEENEMPRTTFDVVGDKLGRDGGSSIRKTAGYLCADSGRQSKALLERVLGETLDCGRF